MTHILLPYERFATEEVKVGNVLLGGNNPVRIQSMASVSTIDTTACVEQAIRSVQAGCEIFRFTTRNIREAENLKNIRELLKIEGYNIPLVADVHFNPEIALHAAVHADKVRINPGNYAFSDLSQLNTELQHLIQVCGKHNTAIRIGVNHGSLSQRIMDKYGDTPLGMVESAFEFIRICHEENFHNLVISLKSSNTRIMIDSNRLLVNKMQKEGLNYPIHLGVTEAGEGEDGRIKSAIGIGTLLEEGIGDTIRVSLTENPEFEIPVAKTILRRYKKKKYYYPLPNIRDSIPVPEIAEDINSKYIILETNQKEYVPVIRKKLSDITNNSNKPVLISKDYGSIDLNQLIIDASIDIGSLFLDGFGDAIWISAEKFDKSQMEHLMLGILQASRRRFSKTEFISCPSCGRTLFNIQEALKKVKEKTGHLKNLKIAVMGCIVNGPGEMADADYGYVGAGKGKITLYKNKQVVKKNIDESKAVDELIQLIKDSGDWHKSI